MKKGIFGVWFKELATLIFTQTVQAFLLAIIMAIIVQALQSSSGVGSTYGAGLLAIIALSQFNKIELLIKNIFGVTSQFNVGMDSGRAGLLGSLMLGKMALSGAKKVGDNAGKILDGRREAKASKARTNALLAKQGTDQLSGEAAAVQEELLNQAGDYTDNMVKGAAYSHGAQAVGGAGGAGNGVGVTASQIQELKAAVKEQTGEIKSQTSEIKAGKLSAGKDDVKEKMKALDDQIRESRNNTTRAKLKALSGVAETLVDIPVGALGVATGLAEGSLAKGVGYGLTAAGVADSAISHTIQNNGERVIKEVDRRETIKRDNNTSAGFTKDQLKGFERAIKEANAGKAGETRQKYDAAKISLNINNEIKNSIKKESVKVMSPSSGSSMNNTKKNMSSRNNAKFDAGNN
ncbi:MAG: hypothetical protein IKD74_02285 [Clostridia bacterium]|nr:hypothetical protein [Clostridia bacterium]